MACAIQPTVLPVANKASALPGGTLSLGTVGLLPSARIAVDSGGSVSAAEDTTTAGLAGLAAAITHVAGARVLYQGTVDNTGGTLDLSAGGAVRSALTSVNGYTPDGAYGTINTGLNGVITGGVVLNTGAAQPLQGEELHGVTLRGAFTAGGLNDPLLVVQDGLQVQNLDGSPGTLDLSAAGNGGYAATLLIRASSDGSSPATLGSMTLKAPGIEAQATTILLPGFTLLASGSGAVSGFVTNQGTITLADNAGISTSLGGPNDDINTNGSFENNGTINVGAGDALAAKAGTEVVNSFGVAHRLASGFNNKGAINLGSGASASFGQGATPGTLNLVGAGAHLTFTGTGTAATLNGLQAGDSMFVNTGIAGSYQLAVAGPAGSQSLLVQENGATVASFALGGSATAYSAADFAATATKGGDGTLATGALSITTTHKLSAGAAVGYPVASGTSPQDALFDRAYYLAHNPDVATSGLDPYQHYMAYGWKEGRDPSALFSTTYYLSQNPDVRAAGINPLLHFEQSGWREGRDPSSQFSDAAYLKQNGDVAAAGIDPLLHYTLNGQAEGRARFLATPHATGPQDPLVDAAYVYAQRPDVAAPGLDTTFWFHQYGWKEGANPDALFDVGYYLSHNPDVAAAHVDPLLHFEQSGWKEGRDPSAGFSDRGYLAHNPDVAAGGVDPLLHYVQHGQAEGRAVYSV